MTTNKKILLNEKCKISIKKFFFVKNLITRVMSYFKILKAPP